MLARPTTRTIALAIVAVALVVGGVAAAIGLSGSRFGLSSAPPSVSPAPSNSPTPRPTPVAPPTPIPLNQELLNSRITVLILGKDSNEGRAARGDETNTDAMIVASVSADQGRISMVAVPRDTVDVPLADGSVWTNKINSLTRFLGHEALRGAFETMLGIDIDYYMEIDMDDFVHLVDAVGGVDVQVPYALFDPGQRFAIDPGPQHLDGARALAYTRTRVQDGDYARQRRQQEVLLALFNKLSDPRTHLDVVELAAGLDSLQTDVPLDEWRTFLAIARRARDASATIQVLQPPQFALFEGASGARGWVMIPNIAAMQAYARSVMGD